MTSPAPVTLHHVELYVRDLERSMRFWTPFMALLGYEAERWSQGVNYLAGEQDPYVCLVQAPPEHQGAGYHRRRVGLNHLAFRASVARPRRRGAGSGHRRRGTRCSTTTVTRSLRRPGTTRCSARTRTGSSWKWWRRARGDGGHRQSKMTSNATIDHATIATMTAPVAMPTVMLAGIDTQPSSITYSVPPLQRLGGVRP